MAAELGPLSVVLLAAGNSVRMGTPKHLLPFYDGLVSYQNRLLMLQKALPDARRFCVFLKFPSDQEHIQSPPGLDISCVFENALDKASYQDRSTGLGSMAGLLCAHQTDPNSSWLVLPCDYPLMTVEEIKRLRVEYRSPVTCFQNGQSFVEPYAGIWSPEALAALQGRVATGLTDYVSVPRNLITDLGGKVVRPLYYHSLFNTNTREDFEHAMNLLRMNENLKASNGTAAETAI
jgi:molybdopterin-guanine dinucleotide biosynthesis protein A